MKIGFIVEGSTSEVGDRFAVEALCKKVADAANLTYETIVIAGRSKVAMREDACGHVDSMRSIGCERIFFIWDSCPPWSPPDMGIEDFVWAFGIWRRIRRRTSKTSDIHLICIRRELEAWLLTDGRAASTVLDGLSRSRLTRSPDQNNPDSIAKPKDMLHRQWYNVCGRPPFGREYGLMAAECRLSKLRKSPSFVRFEEMLTG